MTIIFGIIFLVIAVVMTLLSVPYDWLSGITVIFWALAASCIIFGGVDKGRSIQ